LQPEKHITSLDIIWNMKVSLLCRWLVWHANWRVWEPYRIVSHVRYIAAMGANRKAWKLKWPKCGGYYHLVCSVLLASSETQEYFFMPSFLAPENKTPVNLVWWSFFLKPRFNMVTFKFLDPAAFPLCEILDVHWLTSAGRPISKENLDFRNMHNFF